MSREFRGKFLGLFDCTYKSTPVIVTPNVAPCRTTQYLFTRKTHDNRIVVVHGNDNGETNMVQQDIKGTNEQ